MFRGDFVSVSLCFFLYFDPYTPVHSLASASVVDFPSLSDMLNLSPVVNSPC